jgi:hypothetical protein
MKKVKIHFKGNVVKTFEVDKINIIPVPSGQGPSFFEIRKKSDNKYSILSTNDMLPDISFLEKIEIVEEDG